MQVFIVGDVVKLKGSIPMTIGDVSMTVSHVSDAGDVICTWMDVNHQVQQAGFKKAMLVILKTDGENK